MSKIKDLIKERTFIIVMCVLLIAAGFTSLFCSRISYLSFYKHVENICDKLPDLKKIEDNKALEKEMKGVMAGELQSLQKVSFWKSFLNHLSIAFFLSVILILVVELHTRERFRREAGEDVLFAVLKKQIPEAVFIQIQDHILRSPYFRKDWHYSFVFRGQPYKGLDDNLIVYDLGVSWTIKNITHDKIYYTPQSLFFNHPRAVVHDNSGNEIHLSRHGEVLIDGVRILDKDQIEKQEMAQREKDRISLDIKPITLKPNQEIRIDTHQENVDYIPNEGVFSIIGYSENLKITINNEAPDIINSIKVFFLHPNEDKLLHIESTREWEYKGGILPYQSFRLIWERVSKVNKSH